MSVCIPCRNWETPRSSIDHDIKISQLEVNPFDKDKSNSLDKKQSFVNYLSDVMERQYHNISEGVF
jgi:hypothetical protein